MAVNPTRPPTSSSYRFVYPFDAPTVDRLANFFDYDFDGKDEVPRWSLPMHAAVEAWKARHAHSRLEVVAGTTDAIVVWDSRDLSRPRNYAFGRPEKTVVEAAATACTFEQLHRRVEKAEGAAAPSRDWLRGFLRYLVDHRLVVHGDGRYLSVVLPRAPGRG